MARVVLLAGLAVGFAFGLTSVAEFPRDVGPSMIASGATSQFAGR